MGVSTRVATTLAIASPSSPCQRRPVCALSRMYAAQAAPASSANSTPTTSRSAGSRPSSATPSPASTTQARSRGRRDPMTARVSGPMNSMVTAIPSGIRAKDW